MVLNIVDGLSNESAASVGFATQLEALQSRFDNLHAGDTSSSTAAV